MNKIEVTNLTPDELKSMIDESVMNALRTLKEEDQKPSEWEDISLKNAAAELNCSIRTVQRRMKELKIRGFRVGKEMIIQRKDLKKIKLAS